jgi:hypothetical protein
MQVSFSTSVLMAFSPLKHLHPKYARHGLTFGVGLCTCLASLHFSPTIHAEPRYSPYLLGSLGLNTVPNARMNPQGTFAVGLSTQDRYLHSYIGAQIADPLYIGLRQSAEISSLGAEPTRLSPGIDFKLRLLTENKITPEISIGAHSAIGHKRTASEYIALSKRYNNFDFTLGAAWGRMGSAGHISNPFKSLGGHFNKKRDIDGNQRNGPSDWLTGDEIGFFGGVEYFTPWDGLSIKADWGADDYSFERSAFGFQPPAPWSASLVYNYKDYASLSVGTQGGEKIMGLIHFQAPSRTISANMKEKKSDIEKLWDKTEAPVYDPKLANIQQTQDTLSADLYLDQHSSTPDQIQNAAKYLMSHATPQTIYFKITPYRGALKIKTLSIMVKDFERAYSSKDTSGEELWRKTLFESRASDTNAASVPIIPKDKRPDFSGVSFELETQTSTQEADSNGSLRSSFIVQYRTRPVLKFLTTGSALRFNLQHAHPDGFYELRPIPRKNIRYDFDQFADKLVSLDRLYVNAQKSINDTTHISLTGGYLEEMYGGIGGEVLYRPFQSRLAFGAEGWWVKKRAPFSDLNLDFTDTGASFTGHINAWYDLHAWDVTLSAKIGQYLGENLGTTFGASKTFNNGSKIAAYTTISENVDRDRFGGEVNTMTGISYTVPFGHWILPDKLRLSLKAEPLGMNVGQIIDAPIKLYDETNTLSYKHLSESWDDITDD